jgi:glycosidase
MEQNAAWWKNSVVYQIYPRSFQDSNGDGVGDLPGIVQRLPYLASLGVDVVWLCPMFASPHDDNGYDISDYQAVDPQFGTLADLDELVARGRDLGIKIVLDLVANHTSDEHPWFVESRSSKTNPKRDWYYWKPADGGLPTDWPSFFGGPVWELDPATNEYYLHTFSKKQPDLNWENPAVREALFDMIGWWIDRGIAGFRIDAITFIKKRPDWPRVIDTPPFVPVNEPGILTFLAELRDRVMKPRGMVTVAESPGISPESLDPYVGPDGVFSMVFTFDHMDIDARSGRPQVYEPWTLAEWKRTFSMWQNGTNRSGWLGLYLENHDQVRSVSKFGDPDRCPRLSAQALATWYFLMRGTPFIYQGQELGMSNSPFPRPEDYRDVSAVNALAAARRSGRRGAVEETLVFLALRGRDHARTPMPWSAAPHAGFTTGEPWIAVQPDYPRVNVEAEEGDPGSVLHHYRALIRLRKSEPTLVHGAYEDLWPDSDTLGAYRRRGPGRTITVVVHFGGGSVALPPGLDPGGEVLLATGGAFDGKNLGPWQAVVLAQTEANR